MQENEFEDVCGMSPLCLRLNVLTTCIVSLSLTDLFSEKFSWTSSLIHLRNTGLRKVNSSQYLDAIQLNQTQKAN